MCVCGESAIRRYRHCRNTMLVCGGSPPRFCGLSLFLSTKFHKVSKGEFAKIKQNHLEVGNYSVRPVSEMLVNHNRHANRRHFQPVFMRLLAIWRSEHAFWACWLKPSVHFTFIKSSPSQP